MAIPTRLYASANLTRDVSKGTRRQYLKALAQHEGFDLEGITYHSRDAIFRAMLSVTGKGEDAPFLLLGDAPRSPDLFLAKLVPADTAPAEPWQKMFHGLTSEGMNFGEVMQEYRFDVTLDALLTAEVRGTSNDGHYRITECANVTAGTAYLLGGSTAPSRLPDGSYVLVEKTSDCYS